MGRTTFPGTTETSMVTLAAMQREYIETGSFGIDTSGDKLLTVVLGATVGVALYDETAGVGGIIHLLLPKPRARAAVWNPEIYASSGLPIFIEKILEAGGERERLKAVVAKGSFFGSREKQGPDTLLNWRTADIALEVLNEERIPVVRSESGCDFFSTLLLDTRTWHATIGPIALPDQPAAAHEINEPLTGLPPGKRDEDETPALARPALGHPCPSAGLPPSLARPALGHPCPSAAEIEEAIAQVKPLPAIALKVIQLLHGQEYHMAEVAEHIRRDQVIVAKVLQYSNSALMETGRKIDSIDRALLLLGERNLFEIVIAAAIHSFLGNRAGDGYELERGGFYRHGLATAHVAREIANFTGWVDPGTAYTAGLLHDIGKVVLDNFAANLQSVVFQTSSDVHDDFVGLEKKIFGVCHQEVGKRLAERWQLPLSLIKVIAFHHYPEKADTNRKLVTLVYIADLLASGFMAGLELERINTGLIEKRLEEIGLEFSHLPLIVDRIPWQKLMSMQGSPG